VVEEGCYGAINLETGEPILFVPRMNNLYKIWMTVRSKEDFQKKYEM
jgi:hypothetical protein